MRNLTLAACALLLPACGQETVYHSTPAGFRYNWNEGDAPASLQVQLDLDASIQVDAVAELAPYGADAARVIAQARVISYHLYPGKIATHASPTGYAAGVAHIGVRVIEIAHQVPGNPKPFPAMGHELGHFLFGGAFGH